MKIKQPLFFASLTVLLVAAPFLRAQPTCPAQARAAGFTNLVFDDEFTTQSVTSTYTGAYVNGINWYPFSWAGANGGMTITTGTSTVAGQSIVGNFLDTTGQVNTLPSYPPQPTGSVQANGGTPVPYTNSWHHAYFEARIQTAGEEPSGAKGWPAFWLIGTSYFQHVGTGWNLGQTTECDIMEWYPVNTTQLYGINTIHNWQHGSGVMGTDTYNTGQSSSNGRADNFMTALLNPPSYPATTGPTVSEAADPTDGAWHTWGCLWTATGPLTGQVQFYEDNYLISHSGVTTFATGEGTQLPQMEMENMFILMGPGGSAWPINVDFVRVWQGAQPTTTPQQIIGFQSTNTYTTSSTPVVLPATTAQGLPITYTIFSGTATVSGNNLYLTNAGTVIVTATQAGNSTYSPLSMFETITVTGSTVSAPTLTAQTVSGFPSTLSLTTAQSPYTLPATTSAGLTLSYSVVSGPATVSGNKLTLTGSGTVIVSASQAGNSSYSAYSGSETIAVASNQTAQTVSGFPSSLSLSTDQSPYALPATTSAGLPITYSVASGPATVSGDSLRLTGPGTVIVNASQAGNSTYADWTGSETITVTAPGTQTIANFPSTLDLMTTASPYTLPATTSAGLTVTYTVASGPATVAGNTLTLTGAGTVVLDASQAGNSSYAAYSGTQTITVTAAPQTVSNFPATTSVTTAQTPYALPATTSAGLTLSYAVKSGPASVSGHMLALSGAGTAVVAATQPGNAMYAAYSGTETLSIASMGTQTVSNFPSTLSLSTTQSPYTLPATTSAGQTLSYSVVSGPASVSGDTLTLTGAGTVVLTASAAANSSYSAYSGQEAITVTTASQTVGGFPATLSLTTAQSPYTLPALSLAGLTMSYSVTSGSASVSGNKLTFTSPGTIVVKGTQAGDAIWAPYTGTETITVSALASQTVASLPSTQTVTLGSGSIALPSTTSAGLPITYSVVSGPATISGDTLTITGTGTVVVSATQAGNTSVAAYTGTETITVAAGSSLSFAQWEAQPGFFTSAQIANTAVSGPTAAPENDGVPNLLKYVYDIDPATPMTTADYSAMAQTDVDTTTTPGTTYLTLTFRKYAKLTGVTIQVQTSPDLQTWTTVTPAISRQIGTDSTTGDPIVEDEVNTGGATSEFIRLNVTQP